MQIGSKKIESSNKIKNNNLNDKIVKKSMSEGKYSVYGVILRPGSNAKEELKKEKQN
jgi:hypothetical protein